MTLEQVAVAAEIEDAASVRMSQYQRGVHTPRFNIAQNLAKALDVPVEYFYSPDDQTAELLLQWHKLSKARRGEGSCSARSKNRYRPPGLAQVLFFDR